MTFTAEPFIHSNGADRDDVRGTMSVTDELVKPAFGDDRIFEAELADDLAKEGRLSPAIGDQWTYFEDKSRELTVLDRSAIYGGFHIYGKKA